MKTWEKLTITAIEVLAIVAIIWGLVTILGGLGRAEEATADGWVMCHPFSYVNARSTPSTRQKSEGMLKTGYRLNLDGKTKNGYAHCVDMNLEITEGWVHLGYIVFDEPVWEEGKWYCVESNGRVATHKTMTSGVSGWLKPSTEIQVFWWSEEWCYTTRGYVQTKYLVKEGGQDE